jgi:hypothetical protein
VTFVKIPHGGTKEWSAVTSVAVGICLHVFDVSMMSMAPFQLHNKKKPRRLMTGGLQMGFDHATNYLPSQSLRDPSGAPSNKSTGCVKVFLQGLFSKCLTLLPISV